MTCIAGLVDKGVVYMGADSMGQLGDEAVTLAKPKVFFVGEFLVGVSGSLRMIQAIQYMWQPPAHPNGVSIDRFMVEGVAESIRLTLKDINYSTQENGNQDGMDSTIMLGYRGRLFRVDGAFAIGESKLPYNACGSGVEVALGSFYSSKGMEPRKRVKLALEAAAHHIASVRGPFTILALERKTISKE